MCANEWNYNNFVDIVYMYRMKWFIYNNDKQDTDDKWTKKKVELIRKWNGFGRWNRRNSKKADIYMNNIHKWHNLMFAFSE